MFGAEPTISRNPRRATTKAIIFDVFNTLFDNSREPWLVTFNTICSEQSLSVSPEELYQHWRALDTMARKGRVNLDAPELSPKFKPYREIWENCFSTAFGELGLEADASAATTRALTDLTQRTAFPESSTVVTTLHTKYKTGVLSNGDDSFLWPLLENSGLPFDVAICSETVGAYKPHPLTFTRVLEDLQTDAQDAIFVGDTLYEDILGAQRIGMHTVLINWNKVSVDTSLVKPDYQIHNLTKLLDILETIEGGFQ